MKNTKSYREYISSKQASITKLLRAYSGVVRLYQHAYQQEVGGDAGIAERARTHAVRIIEGISGLGTSRRDSSES